MGHADLFYEVVKVKPFKAKGKVRQSYGAPINQNQNPQPNDFINVSICLIHCILHLHWKLLQKAISLSRKWLLKI
jgi:hypothetical protein